LGIEERRAIRAMRACERYGRQSAALVACHDAHDEGSPALAIAWQSAATLAGREQLVAQNVLRSSQLRSGGALLPPASSLPGPLPGTDDPGVSVHVPR
jgi:hypothetical protein